MQMFKKLVNALIGDFPPKFVPLCDNCRTAYTVTGLIKPPQTTFEELVFILYIHDLLCTKICGVTRKKHLNAIRDTPRLLSEINNKASYIYHELGINCRQCQISLLTMAIFIQDTNIIDFNSHTQILRRKNLICNSCQCISVDQYDSHVKAIESIMLSSESVVATYFKRIDQRPL